MGHHSTPRYHFSLLCFHPTQCPGGDVEVVPWHHLSRPALFLSTSHAGCCFGDLWCWKCTKRPYWHSQRVERRVWKHCDCQLHAMQAGDSYRLIRNWQSVDCNRRHLHSRHDSRMCFNETLLPAFQVPQQLVTRSKINGYEFERRNDTSAGFRRAPSFISFNFPNNHHHHSFLYWKSHTQHERSVLARTRACRTRVVAAFSVRMCSCKRQGAVGFADRLCAILAHTHHSRHGLWGTDGASHCDRARERFFVPRANSNGSQCSCTRF